MISLKYALTKDDYINYSTYVTWDAPGNKRKRVIYYGKQLVPIVLFILAFYYTGLFDRGTNFIKLILGFLLATTLLSLVGVRNNAVKQAEKIAEEPGNASIFLDLSLNVSETGIIVRDEVKETKYTWTAIIKKLESKNYYFLFHNSVQAIIIPKRAFNSDLEKLQFEKLLAQFLSFEAEVSHLLKK